MIRRFPDATVAVHEAVGHGKHVAGPGGAHLIGDRFERLGASVNLFIQIDDISLAIVFDQPVMFPHPIIKLGGINVVFTQGLDLVGTVVRLLTFVVIGEKSVPGKLCPIRRHIDRSRAAVANHSAVHQIHVHTVTAKIMRGHRPREVQVCARTIYQHNVGREGRDVGEQLHQAHVDFRLHRIGSVGVKQLDRDVRRVARIIARFVSIHVAY